ncbi:phosphoribulokinase [Methanoregula sp.]|uniref:phosphoribulokinase n=1 Tax=Methanoregula sp. TaxID=2052170 RepID=UPI00236B028A|nr:phosphoribulokinase [Methanoregula sp.]MDD1687655.1 phosphoribulokinase [Methanoregula sp.]
MDHPPNFKEIIARSPIVFTIGVAGDSGSGKTTFTNAIRQIFGPHLVSTITLDDYHKYDREERKQRDITPLHPDANNIAQLEIDVARLKQGLSIEKPVYNHATGRFDPPVPFTPGKILILEGLHTLFTPRLRDLMDFSIFVDPEKEVKYAWKRVRDMGRRGYSSTEVTEEIVRREKDYDMYIAPQRCDADAIIRIAHSKYGKENGPERNVYNISLMQNRMNHRIADVDLNIDLNSLLSFHDRDFLIEFSTQFVDCAKMRVLTFDGEMNYDTIRKLEKSIEQQTGIHPIAMFEGRETVTATDIVQLILSWRIIHRRIFTGERA